MGKRFVITLFLFFIFLSGCQSNNELSISETSAEIIKTTEEIVKMNNCGGKGDSTQQLERSRAIQIEFSGELGVSAQIVRGDVSAKYSQIDEVSKRIELIAPPGTNMEFTIKWTEKSWGGIVTSDKQSGQANYRVSVPISVELISSNDIMCSTSLSGSDETQTNNDEQFNETIESNNTSASILYIFGYSNSDLAVKEAMNNCPNCQIEQISSLDQLPDNWYHYTHNIASQTANLSNACRDKNELINLSVTYMIANNYTPCP